MTIYQELLFAASHPVCVIAGLVLLGWVFRVDRRKGGGR